MQQSRPYRKFNREERNYTALICQALLSGRNLSHLLQKLRTRNITPSHLGPTEVQDVSMYVEYALPPRPLGRQKEPTNRRMRSTLRAARPCSIYFNRQTGGN